MRKNEKIVLKPCPFCKGTGRVFTGNEVHYVQCDGCGARGPTTTNKPDCAHEWNDRSTLSESASEKDPSVKIIQILIGPDNSTYQGTMFGLGDNGKVYYAGSKAVWHDYGIDFPKVSNDT